MTDPKRYFCEYRPTYGIGSQIKFVDGYWPPLKEPPCVNEVLQGHIETHKWFGIHIFLAPSKKDEPTKAVVKKNLDITNIPKPAPAPPAPRPEREVPRPDNGESRFVSIESIVARGRLNAVPVAEEVIEDDDDDDQEPMPVLDRIDEKTPSIEEAAQIMVPGFEHPGKPMMVPSKSKIGKMIKRELISLSRNWKIDVSKGATAQEMKRAAMAHFSPLWSKGIKEV